MKTIMIVGEKSTHINELKKYFSDDTLNIISVDNSREAIEIIENDSDKNINLVLINTQTPNGENSAFFKMKPESNMNIFSSNNENFLQKPFSKNQFMDFIKRNTNFK